MSESENDGETQNSRINQVQQRVVEIMEKDLFAAEMKLSLFMCALQSYRYDSILRPFPPVGLKEDGSKDVQKLVLFTITN